ncbi:MAG: class I SAM-dependent methyltransferase, partial [Patescibacteria group bacterium]|nr:class I SAM-dependent methyltransferase [Patescibacteria group bacterium]
MQPIEKQMYKYRFSSEIKARNILWRVLVNHFFQQYVSKKAVVLDLATGYGEFINNINAKKKFACDINPDSKKYLSKNVTFIQSSSTNIKLRTGSVDIIFVSNFFEHITRDEIVK